MKVLVFLITLAVLSSVTLGIVHAEKLSTEKGTLNVDLEVEPSENPNQSKLKINFLNPVTGKIQVHIDYNVAVFDKSGNSVFGPTPLIHTSVGSVSIPVEITPDGKYDVLVNVEGILFQPIESEAVTFSIGGVEQKPDSESEQGGCLIATAVYGSELAPQVQHMRQIRDTVLQNSNAGSAFMASFNAIYYAFSPTIADFERENEPFREMMRAYLYPLIATLSVMEHADSETKIIAYGVGLILLNAAIYIIAPVTATILAYKRILKMTHPNVPFIRNNAT